MNYPDAMTMRAYDAAQGRDEGPDDRAEHEAIRAALAKVQDAADTLRGIETSNVILNVDCICAGRELEEMLGRLWRAIP